MTIGEPFNPRYEACRFFPADIVDRRNDLNASQKLLFRRWARFKDGERYNERAGEVWRSEENMAGELGKSLRQISRVLKNQVGGLIP